jgi:hypothetical protein
MASQEFESRSLRSRIALGASLLALSLGACGKREVRLRQGERGEPTFREGTVTEVAVGQAFELTLDLPGPSGLRTDGFGKVIFLDVFESTDCTGRRLFPTYGEQVANGAAVFRSLTLTSPGTYSFQATGDGIDPVCRVVRANPDYGAAPGIETVPRAVRVRSGTLPVFGGIASHLVVLTRPASGVLSGTVRVDVLSGASTLIDVPCQITTTAPAQNLAVAPNVLTPSGTLGLDAQIAISDLSPLGQYRATVQCDGAPAAELHISVL